MQPLFNGLFFGLALTILLGPIFFTLVQAGMERGFRAGLAMVIGIFVSDLLFFTSVYLGLKEVIALTQAKGFSISVGIAGGIILFLIGVLTILRKPPKTKKLFLSKKKQRISYLGFLLKGFLINTLNPFTFFFWISVMTAVVLKNNYTTQQAILFFSGIMLVITCSDSLKVYSAKYISQKLKPIHILRMRQISGTALIIFGIILMIRVLCAT